MREPRNGGFGINTKESRKRNSTSFAKGYTTVLTWCRHYRHQRFITLTEG
jgi:hypothetical protein